VLDTATILLLIAGLLVVVGVIQPLAIALRLPNTVLLAIVGVGLGIASSFLLHHTSTKALAELAQPLADLPVKSSTFLFVFLPLLLFQAALTLDVRRILEDAAPILLLAVVAVVVATVVIGFSLSALAGMPIAVCMLLGSIVATTDPAAVVAIFRDLGTPGRLTRLVEGESLLNDAAAIVLFTVLLGMVVSKRQPDIVDALMQFGISFGGGIAIGLVGGRLVAMVLPRLRGLRLAEMTLTLALPYLVFIPAERFLHVSGVVAVVVAGLVLGAVGRARISPANWSYLEGVWEQVAFWAGSLVFILAALLIPRLLITIRPQDVLLIAVLVVAAFAARALTLFLLLPPLCALRLTERIRHAYKIVITWGGLRGAVTLALALAVTENYRLDPEVKRFVAVLATGFVLFTLLVNGTTLRAVIRLLKLDRLSPLDQALRDQVLALSLAEVSDAVQDTARQYEIAPSVARAVTRPYDARVLEATSRGSVEESISDRDRITIGLIALANRERALIFRHYDQRTISSYIAEVMLRNTTRILEGARSGGRIGYNRASRRILEYRLPFRIAHALHRRLGVERVLARQVADRFEVLTVRRLVLEELRRFDERRLSPLLGKRVAELLGEVLAGRLDATAKALNAMRLQYPDYAEALERRFLQQSALRLELDEYQALYDDGLIGPELFDNLRRGVEKAQRVAQHRPRLDLGLNTRDLLKQLDLFADLDAKQLKRIGRLFRPRFAVPGEVIVRKGGRADAVYFVSSGAVEVLLPDSRVRLGRGDFFGEMGLLKGGRRGADVVALTYCQLMVLDDRDFRRFLRTNPTAKAQIDRVAAARARMNAGNDPPFPAVEAKALDAVEVSRADSVRGDDSAIPATQ
jgi:CPA1 family monovalent cation:H+ antiporter